MENEVWLPCVGFPGYEVSDLGRVRSLDRVVSVNGGKGAYTYTLKGKVLATTPDKRGYTRICLRGSPGTPPTQVLVHRLVAMAHIRMPLPHETQVNHINFDCRENRASNLEWCTPKENMRHSAVNGRLEGINSKLTREQVDEIRSLALAGATSQRAIASMFGVDKVTVCNILQGHTWASGDKKGVKVPNNFKRGRNLNGAKLTEDDVRWIRREGSTSTVKFLASRFGVSTGCINHVRYGKVWPNVT